MAIEKSSSFSRTIANESKMGAYYTDLSHCQSIRTMLDFDVDAHFNALDPSIGNGVALLSVTSGVEDISLFGVELNDEVADNLKQDGRIGHVVKADFTNGVTITKSAFSLIFSNPPYMEVDGRRMEDIFLEKCISLLKIGGCIVWVVPHRVLSSERHYRMLLRNFEQVALYKFREKEYEKWHQIVFVGVKTPQRMLMVDEFKEKFSQIQSVEAIPELPTSFDEPVVKILPVKDEDVAVFAPRIFDPTGAYQKLSQGMPDEIGKVFSRYASPQTYKANQLGSPPMPLKKDHMYLLSVSGYGQGYAGSEECGTLHLQRGTAQVVSHLSVKGGDSLEDDDNGKVTLIETSTTEISLTVIESNGNITELK